MDGDGPPVAVTLGTATLIAALTLPLWLPAFGL